MGEANIEKGFIRYDFDCGIKIDAIDIGEGLGKFLCVYSLTFTKVVFPVPDMPITMMH